MLRRLFYILFKNSNVYLSKCNTSNLSKEDIEQLGWVYNQKSQRYEYNDNINLIYPRHYYLYHREGDNVYKSIITLYLNGTSQSDLMCQKMWVKNQDELHKAMIQFNIIDEDEQFIRNKKLSKLGI